MGGLVDLGEGVGVQDVRNAAPHHPTWHTDQNWMRRVNARITAG
jgi:hypothetical protein